MAGFAWLIQLSKAFSGNKTKPPKLKCKKKKLKSNPQTNQACRNLRSTWHVSSQREPGIVTGGPGIRTASRRRPHTCSHLALWDQTPLGWKESGRKILKSVHAVNITRQSLQLHIFSIGCYPRYQWENASFQLLIITAVPSLIIITIIITIIANIESGHLMYQ